jgi:hypothetical protein
LHELGMCSCIFGVYGAFFYEVNYEVEAPEQDHVLLVPGQAVCLLDKNRPARLQTLESFDHLIEFGPAWIFGRLDIDELSNYTEPEANRKLTRNAILVYHIYA